MDGEILCLVDESDLGFLGIDSGDNPFILLQRNKYQQYSLHFEAKNNSLLQVKEWIAENEEYLFSSSLNDPHSK